MGKQTYKLKLPKKWKVHNMFYVSLLEQNITKKRKVSEKVAKLDTGNKNSKEYKMETIWDSVVYAREAKGHLSGFII